MHFSNRFWLLVREQMKQSRVGVVLATLSMVAMAVTDLLRPWPLKTILDNVLLDRPLSSSWPSSLQSLFRDEKNWSIILISSTIVVVALLRGLFAYLESYHTSKLGNDLAFRIRTALFSHVQRLSLAFHTRSHTGALMTKMASDTNVVRNFFSETILVAGTHVLTIASTFVVMLWMNWRLGLVVLLSMPILFLTIAILHRQASQAAKRHRKKEEGLANRINEVLGTVHLIQAFGRENYEQRRFEEESREHLEDGLKNARIESTAARAVELTTASATCGVILYGSLQVLDGRMSPGDILVFSSYLHGLYRPIRRMVKLIIQISNVQVSIGRISELLEQPMDVQDSPHARQAHALTGSIEFRDVSFAYTSNESEVLRNLSFQIEPGQRVAIVGASGAGKSTILGLLLRLYDPQSGSILVDGLPLRDYRRESYRHQIGLVMQDSVLLGATIYENIAYGNLQATREMVIEAAKAAYAHDFILSLENGYETVIGERGARLSGGQQRRIAIARAIVRNAPILILDEPMTGLDRDSEAKVKQSLSQLMHGRTCLIVTHDERHAAECDMLVSLQGGRANVSSPSGRGRLKSSPSRCS